MFISTADIVNILLFQESDCYLLPDSLSDQDAVMIEPTTIAIQSCTRAQLEKDDMLLIFGAGALGSTILKVARQLCDHIIVADIMDEKLEAAKKNGAKYTINVLKEDLVEKVKEYTFGHGTTVSIDSACTKDSLINLLQATGNAGRVMTMGFSTAPTEVNQFVITSKELDVRGSRLQNKMFGKAIEMINAGTLDLSNSISHTFPLTKKHRKHSILLIPAIHPSGRSYLPLITFNHSFSIILPVTEGGCIP